MRASRLCAKSTRSIEQISRATVCSACARHLCNFRGSVAVRQINYKKTFREFYRSSEGFLLLLLTDNRLNLCLLCAFLFFCRSNPCAIRLLCRFYTNIRARECFAEKSPHTARLYKAYSLLLRQVRLSLFVRAIHNDRPVVLRYGKIAGRGYLRGRFSYFQPVCGGMAIECAAPPFILSYHPV